MAAEGRASEWAGFCATPVRLSSLSAEKSREVVLAYTFIPAPLVDYRCCILWNKSGIFSMFFLPGAEKINSNVCIPADFPLHILKRWPQLRTQASTEVQLVVEDTLQGIQRILDMASNTLILSGTEYQRRVWNAAMTLPVGSTSTYAEIAAKIGAPRSWRAVANALAANPLLWIVPCHRVVPKSGGAGGYRGGAYLKQELLKLEATKHKYNQTED